MPLTINSFLLESALTVPAHFEMFAGNMEDPALFADYMAVKYPGLRVVVPEHGARTRVVLGGLAVTVQVEEGNSRGS